MNHEPPPVVACPDEFVPLVAQLAENDAQALFRLLWQAIGEWHLQGILDEPT